MADQNLFQEVQEDLERQKFEELWKRYGPWLIAAAVIIVLGTAGLTTYRTMRAEKEQAATSGLVEVMDKYDVEPNKQMADLEAFAMKYPNTSQAVLAQMGAAGLAARSGNAERAVQLYDRLANDASVEPVFRQFAELMSIRAQMDTADAAELQKKLKPLEEKSVPWHFTAMEYDGFLALKTGDKAKARVIFTELSQDAEVPETMGARATDILRYISE